MNLYKAMLNYPRYWNADSSLMKDINENLGEEEGRVWVHKHVMGYRVSDKNWFSLAHSDKTRSYKCCYKEMSETLLFM